MRIGDWSSDVCSSDLYHQPRARAGGPFDAEAQMIVSAAFRGKRYAVFGLARSGLAAVRALVASGADVIAWDDNEAARRSEEHTSELQSLMRISYAVFCLKKQKTT